MESWIRLILNEENIRMLVIIAVIMIGFMRVDKRFVEVDAKMDKRFAEVDKRFIEMKAELKENIANVRSELKEDIANVRSELKEDIARVETCFNTKFDMLKSNDFAHLNKDFKNLGNAFKNLTFVLQDRKLISGEDKAFIDEALDA